MLVYFSLEVLYRRILKKKNHTNFSCSTKSNCDKNLYLLFPWVSLERAAAPTGGTAYAAGWDMLLSFHCSFCNVPSTHQYSSLMPSLISCFGSISCSMPPYSHPGAVSSPSPSSQLASSSLQKPESQPTLYILIPKSPRLTHATPTSVPGTPCSLPHQ